MIKKSNISLPGGLLVNGKLRKDFQFNVINGEREMYFSNNMGESNMGESFNFPSLVSKLLCRALYKIGGQQVTLEQVKLLSVGDRQFLIKELAAKMIKHESWVSSDCRQCGEKMDLSFRYQDLPVKPASSKFPEFDMKIGMNDYRLRVPNGLDQEMLADVIDKTQALTLLLKRITKPKFSKDNKSKKIKVAFSAQEINQLEKAVESASPEVGTRLLTHCPVCNTENHIDIDIYAFLSSGSFQLLSDIHQLASHYHWDEKEILSLPRERRKHYLAMIDRSRGMVGHEPY